ncbi:Nucleo-P87 multi-domain protein [Pyrenophora tritici-repentis]|uniref:Nucleo-P87 multi-domain protein n=1 Tax=Pyrenophora tritici-repentis TaxID=45151 RepID=A0A316ZNR8_9PLEO|nr:Nucleo-P87 multi-domain protein [Pyrenophora tritici-repentis]
MPWEETPEVHEEAELTMTGALPVNEEAQAQPTETRTPASSASKRARSTRGSARSSAKKASPNEIAPLQQDVEAEEDSGFGDLTFSSLGSNSPAHGTRPPSAIKVGATPAHERSVLALTNFKRRARQPSLLRMVQQTDVEDNDDDTLDNTDNFDFDDFLPHAESTPLNVRKNRTEEETRNDSGTHVSSSASRGTKRKLSPAVVQVPRSSPPGSPLSERDIEVERSPSPSLPEVLPSQEQIIGQTQEDEEPMSETLAPPMSSSTIGEESEPPSPAQTRPRRRGRQSKTPVRYNESEAEETETPAKAKRGAKKKAEQKISTAQLKDLLPRRRNRYRDRDEFDVVSSDDIEQVDSDEDELQMPERRVRQRQAAGKLASPKATKKPTRGKKAASKAAQKASKTYSRRISSDKENDKAGQGDAETTEVSAIEHSEKLEAIRKKFAEVDAFELEFEDVTATTSSSPFR